MLRVVIVAGTICSIATVVLGETGIMSSQVGYDLGDPMRIIVRSDRADAIPTTATFVVLDTKKDAIDRGPVESWGEKWGAFWWVADFSGLQHPGTYMVRIQEGAKVLETSDPIEVGDRILWNKSYRVIACDYLRTRSRQARTGKGWKDCGSDLQEFSSHAVCLDGICDLLEIVTENMDASEREFLIGQLIRGGDYLAHLQDKARQFHITLATSKDDRPRYFDDEAYIAHSLPYLAAVARLRDRE